MWLSRPHPTLTQIKAQRPLREHTVRTLKHTQKRVVGDPCPF